MPDDQSTNSGFSFIADNSAQSEFSFLQTPEAPASGFPFLSKDPEHEEGGPSSLFSFMGTVGETDGRSTVEPVSDQEPPSAFTFLSETSCPSEPSTHSGIGQLQHPTDNTINNNARSNIETMDTFKLAKTSLTKQVISACSINTKPGVPRSRNY